MAKNRIWNTPQLVRLRYGNPYCEECRDTLEPGRLVAWWRIRDANGRWRKAVLCAACHHNRIRIRVLKRAEARDAHDDLNRQWRQHERGDV